MAKTLKKIHRYLGLVLCIPLVLQGLVGATLVFQKEISAMLLRQNHVFVEGEMQSPRRLIEVAQPKMPEGFVASLVKIPAEENSPAVIRFTKNGEKTLMLEALIDPVSCEVLKIKNPETDFFRLIRKFHTSLFISGENGKTAVGIFGFVLLFMGLSGLVLWWPKKGNLQRALTFKFASKGKKFHRDLHGAVGFWFLLPLMVVSFAGVYLTFTPATSAVILSIFSGQDLRATAAEFKVEPQKNALTFDSVVSLATSAVEADEKLLSINLPAKPNQPYRVNFAPKNYRDGEPSITVFVDQFEQKIIEKRDPNFYASGEKIIAWQHALHTGEGFGIVWKITVFLVGFLPLLFSFTGIVLWLKKKKERAARLV